MNLSKIFTQIRNNFVIKPKYGVQQTAFINLESETRHISMTLETVNSARVPSRSRILMIVNIVFKLRFTFATYAHFKTQECM